MHSTTRNGKYFGVVLEFLRSGEINIPKGIHYYSAHTKLKSYKIIFELFKDISRRSVLTEARFYLIEGLIELLEQEESNELIEKHILKDDLRFDGYTPSSCSQIYKENTRKRGGRMVFRLR